MALQAQDVSSGIFGYQNITLLGNSDTLVSIPFARLADSTAVIASVSGSTITVQGAPGWTNNQFVYAAGTQTNTYLVRIETNALEGRWFTVTGNTSNTLTVNLNGGTLSGAVSNDTISVVAYWTLGSVFGSGIGSGNGIQLSANTLVHNTEVLIPNLSGNGINLSAAATYYLFTNAGAVNWRKIGDSTNHNDDVLQPNSYLVIRHKNATNTTFTSYGDVVLTKVNIPVRVNSTNKQDNFIALPRPINVSLADSGLASSGAFAPSINTLNHRDELLVFDNSTTNINKSTSGTYYYLSSQWRKVGDSIDYSTSNIFTPGAGYILRKAITNVVPTWTNSATYTNN